MKAIWGQPQVMYDRRQSSDRRTSWRGGRRETDWPDEFARAAKAAKRRRSKRPSDLVH